MKNNDFLCTDKTGCQRKSLFYPLNVQAYETDNYYILQGKMGNVYYLCTQKFGSIIDFCLFCSLL